MLYQLTVQYHCSNRSHPFPPSLPTIPRKQAKFQIEMTPIHRRQVPNLVLRFVLRLLGIGCELPSTIAYDAARVLLLPNESATIVSRSLDAAKNANILVVLPTPSVTPLTVLAVPSPRACTTPPAVEATL